MRGRELHNTIRQPSVGQHAIENLVPSDSTRIDEGGTSRSPTSPPAAAMSWRRVVLTRRIRRASMSCATAMGLVQQELLNKISACEGGRKSSTQESAPSASSATPFFSSPEALLLEPRGPSSRAPRPFFSSPEALLLEPRGPSSRAPRPFFSSPEAPLLEPRGPSSRAPRPFFSSPDALLLELRGPSSRAPRPFFSSSEALLLEPRRPSSRAPRPFFSSPEASLPDLRGLPRLGSPPASCMRRRWGALLLTIWIRESRSEASAEDVRAVESSHLTK